MRAVVAVAVVVLGLVACSTKPNPNRCCTDTSDCEAAGIPEVTPCGDNLVCRGHQCIAETCSSSSQCDLSAPFCVEQSCSPTCTADEQCPGNGGSAEDTHCVGGACVACATSADCAPAAPVCDMGVCRGCAVDSECDSTACDTDSGKCVDETTLVYAAPSGSASGNCSKASPCTITQAFSTIDASRPNIKLASGSYASDAGFSGTFAATVYGPATVNSFTLGGNGGGLRLRDVDVSVIVNCQAATTNGARPQLDLRRVRITPDVTNSPGLGATQCDVMATDLTISAAGTDFVGQVISLDDATVTLDSVRVDGGDPVFFMQNMASITVTNGVFSNQGRGYGLMQLGVSGGLYRETGTIAFSTFYNSTVTCPASSTVLMSFSDNAFLNARSGAPTNTVSGTGCTHSYDMIKPQSTSPGSTNLLNMDPRFVNAAQGDFHLMMGSPAIDAADPTATLSTDYDGITRPQGAGRDLGAFEYKP